MKKQQSHEKGLQVHLPSSESQQARQPEVRPVHVIPVAQRAISIGGVHADDQNDHRRTEIVDEQEASAGYGRGRQPPSSPVLLLVDTLSLH
jgi:hypothetical protein